MKLILNGVSIDWVPPQKSDVQRPTLNILLHQQSFTPPYAVAVNCRFVPKQYYAETELSSGDAIEVLRAVTGG